jgi:hypothetical protein
VFVMAYYNFNIVLCDAYVGRYVVDSSKSAIADLQNADVRRPQEPLPKTECKQSSCGYDN